jgi:hypothetical protein
MKMSARQTSRQNERLVFSFNPAPYRKWEQLNTALSGVSNQNMILKGSMSVASAKWAPSVQPSAKLLIPQGK